MNKRTQYVTSSGYATCTLSRGRTLRVPVIVGIFKHLERQELKAALSDPDVVRKYTGEALRVANWFALRDFPPRWLRECMPRARLSRNRRAALNFMLSGKR